MTSLAMAFGNPRRDAMRWGICLAVMVAVHSAAALALMLEREFKLLRSYEPFFYQQFADLSCHCLFRSIPEQIEYCRQE